MPLAPRRTRGRNGSKVQQWQCWPLVLLLGLIWSVEAAAADAPQAVWENVNRIVAIGDVHGDYDGYRDVLRDAGITDRRGRWDAGRTHFVQVGDVPDRGPDTDKIIDHLMDLETQAERAGGRVHALIGNHEAMNVFGDLRYVHPGEFAALKSRNAKRLRQQYYERVVDYLSQTPEPPIIDDAFRDAWMEQHPLGWVEHRQAWHPDGKFGSWVRSHNTLIRINGILFVHGGIGPTMLDMSIDEVNDRIRGELLDLSDAADRLAENEDGPLWYRGLSQEESPTEAVHLDAVLDHFDAEAIVVGHTPGFGTIVPRYDGRVLVIDSGISKHYGGYRASLLIEAGERFVVQRGERVPLPRTESEVLPYFRTMAELQPDVKNLSVKVKLLEGAVTAPAAPDSEAVLEGELQ